jgi:hypothetical protein
VVPRARGGSLTESTAACGASPTERLAVPKPLTGAPLAHRTGLRLLVAGDPPFVLDVDTARVTPITGIDIRGHPVLTAPTLPPARAVVVAKLPAEHDNPDAIGKACRVAHDNHAQRVTAAVCART